MSDRAGSLEHVSFTYRRARRKALDDFNYGPGGANVAIVDLTVRQDHLIKLLCRFYDPQGGQIKLDNHDLRTFDQPPAALITSCFSNHSYNVNPRREY